MKKYFRYGLFFALGAMLALGFVACGDESSSGPSKNEETGIETEVSSSSEKDEAISSSSAKDEASSSSKKVESSSSTEDSSSSAKNKESSSSGKVESSSSKNEVSSSSKNVQSSSSDKPVESSSSKAKSSSSEISSSSVKPEESSSSDYSSSSVQETSSSSSQESSSGSFVGCIMGSLYDDRDGKTYKTVKIGEQEWMAENLNYDVQNYESSYRSWCYDNKDGKDGEVDNCQKYGRLYRWSVVIDSLTLANDSAITCGHRSLGEGSCSIPNKWKGICPTGWHVPTLKEWNDLIKYVGGSDIAGKKLKSSEGWESLGGINGSDEVCFAGLPVGYKLGTKFYDVSNNMKFWAANANEYSTVSAYAVQGHYRYEWFQSTTETVGPTAVAVRCIKD